MGAPRFLERPGPVRGEAMAFGITGPWVKSGPVRGKAGVGVPAGDAVAWIAAGDRIKAAVTGGRSGLASRRSHPSPPFPPDRGRC